MGKRELCGGLLMVVLGAGAVAEGLRHSVGSLTQMGTGYFPIVLGFILAGIGAVITFGAFVPSVTEAEAERDAAVVRTPDWRGCSAIVLGVAAFILLGDQFGLVPGTFACVFLSALGSRDATLKSALVLSLVLTAIAAGVFWYLLQVQFPILQW